MNDLVNLSAILTEYYKFAIFSKTKSEVMIPHCSYNLQIKLKDGEKQPVRTTYLLLTTKQEVLKEFISKNLNTGFIYVVATTRHSRTNDLTTSKALSRAIK